MRQRLIILLTIYLLFNSALSAQNIKEMNKSELREHIAFLTTKIDSIKKKDIGLQESISKLSKNLSLFEQKNKANEIEIIRLNELILKNENERNLYYRRIRKRCQCSLLFTRAKIKKNLKNII